MSIRLRNFEGLYGDNHHPFTDGFIHHELLEVRSQLYDWDIDEHLHTDLIQLFFFTSGDGVLVSELRRITLTPPCMLLIPTNTLHGFAFQSNMVGEVFTIAEQSLDGFSKLIPTVFLEINQLSQYPLDGLTDEFDTLQWIKNQLIRELNDDRPEKKAQLHSLLQLLLISLYRMRQESAIVGAVSTNRTLQYFNAFQKLIRQSIHELKTIQEYAAALNITAVHLNRICQSVVKKIGPANRSRQPHQRSKEVPAQHDVFVVRNIVCAELQRSRLFFEALQKTNRTFTRSVSEVGEDVAQSLPVPSLLM